MYKSITTYNAGTFELIRALAGRYQPPRRSLLPYILALLGAMAIAWPGVAKADGPRTDLVAHYGIAGLAHTGLYGVYKKLGMPREIAAGFASATTAIGIIAKEAVDRQPDEGDFWAGGLGVVTSHLFILTFEF